MKVFVTILFAIATTSCSQVIIKTNDTIEKGTRTHRTVTQISVDHKVEKAIERLIGTEYRDFMLANNMAKGGFFEINTFDGVAMVTGVVPSRAAADFILKRVEEVPKVVGVIDELGISLETKRDGFPDFLIKREIFLKMKAKFSLKPINYKVSVINGTAFVSGVVDDENELDMLIKSISSVRGVKKIVSHVTIGVKPK